jgi:hypothetical protein
VRSIECEPELVRRAIAVEATCCRLVPDDVEHLPAHVGRKVAKVAHGPELRRQVGARRMRSAMRRVRGSVIVGYPPRRSNSSHRLALGCSPDFPDCRGENG